MHKSVHNKSTHFHLLSFTLGINWEQPTTANQAPSMNPNTSVPYLSWHHLRPAQFGCNSKGDDIGVYPFGTSQDCLVWSHCVELSNFKYTKERAYRATRPLPKHRVTRPLPNTSNYRSFRATRPLSNHRVTRSPFNVFLVTRSIRPYHNS